MSLHGALRPSIPPSADTEFPEQEFRREAIHAREASITAHRRFPFPHSQPQVLQTGLASSVCTAPPPPKLPRSPQPAARSPPNKQTVSALGQQQALVAALQNRSGQQEPRVSSCCTAAAARFGDRIGSDRQGCVGLLMAILVFVKRGLLCAMQRRAHQTALPPRC